MKSTLQNTWLQPAVPTDLVVETIGDVAAAVDAAGSGALPRFWSPPAAAAIHGVLWFAALQRQASSRFALQDPVVILDCADRGDLAYAALREGMKAICFRGSPGMLAKLQALANTLAARIETRHPTVTD